MKNRNEAFGRLLKAGIASIANCEGRTAAVIEEELGTVIGVSADTIQRYKSGVVPLDAKANQLLAEAAVRRGFLGREWLQRFLHAARYPFAEKLLNELCPAPQVRPRPPRVYENLPAPTYSQFVMREQAFAEVTDGLGKRSAAVLIVGLGGNGKTSLAREVAAHCLREDGETQRFDAVVWVSDKDRPGTTNLTTVLDEVARTLDYPGFTQYEHDEKRREVEQLLRRQRVLLVVDNFETITDGALLTWLLNLPEPSKALVTSREYRREWRSSWPVELRGMSEAEAWALITERARVLKIDRLVGERAQLDPLLAATGGNPKALTMTLGLLKYERRPLQEVVDDLYAARGDLFDDLFTRAWALLDEAARRVLLVATFFPTSASGEALSATADVQGFAFDRAVERLADMALLDVQQADLRSLPHYALHPLVRAFAGAKLAEQAGFEAGARERWLQWYSDYTSHVGYCWNDLAKLDMLDYEQETIYIAIIWAFDHQNFASVLRIVQGSGFYYSVRGFWDKKIRIDLMRADAAHILDSPADEIEAIAHYIQILANQERTDDIEAILPRIQDLVKTHQIPIETSYEYLQSMALYWMARTEFLAAIAYLRSPIIEDNILPSHRNIARTYHLGLCYYRSGQLTHAKQLFFDTLKQSQAIGHQRSIMRSLTALASLGFEECRFADVEAYLAECLELAERYGDRKNRAGALYVLGLLLMKRGDLPAARVSFAESIDLFERLGMRRELAEARQALADLA